MRRGIQSERDAACPEAKEAGCRAATGGIGMLLWQGAVAFELFTGQKMPVEEVREKFFAE